MSFTAILMIAIFGAVGVSNLAASHVRGAAADLEPGVRENIYRTLAKSDLLWQILEWGGVLIIVLSMFTSVLGTTNRNLIAACGAVLMCLSNTASAWHTRNVFASEAPGSPASRSSRNAAWLVTVAEIALIAVLFWLLNSRGSFNKFFKDPAGKATKQQSSEDKPNQKGLWLDETLTLQELSWLKKDELEIIANSGGIETKNVAGKTVYRASDIDRLKSQHKSNATLPD